jgi:hypothetical protein
MASPPVRNRNLVIGMACVALVALAVSVAAFRDRLPESLGMVGLAVFVISLAMIVAIGWETRRDMLAARETAARGQMIVMLAAKLRDEDAAKLQEMARRGGPAGEAAALILKGRAERRPPGGGPAA